MGVADVAGAEVENTSIRFSEAADVEVRNTFIHFSEAAPSEPPLRRTKSCPAGLIGGSPAGCPPPAHGSTGSDGCAASPEGAHASGGAWPAVVDDACAGLVAVVVPVPALCSSCACGVPPLTRRARECDERDVQEVFMAAQCGQLERLRQMCYESSAQSAAVQEAIARAVATPYDPFACYVVDAILRAFRGHVREAVKHHHGNYVIQKIVESLPAIHVDFIAEELGGHGASTARHSYGCRTMLRLFRHRSCSACAGEATLSLLEEVMEAFAEDPCGLLCHRYGRHVMHEALESGSPRHQRQVAEAIRSGALRDAPCADAAAWDLPGSAHRARPKMASGPRRSALPSRLSSKP